MGDEVTQGAGDQGVSGAGESGSVAPAGSQNDWTAHIPQEYAAEKFWEPLKGKGFGDVLKTYAEAQKFIGGSIRLPGEKDAPQDREKKLNDVYAKLGRPESPEKYDLKLPEVNGVKWDDNAVGMFKQTAHKLGLNSTQLNGLLTMYGEHLKTVLPNIEELNQKGAQALQEHWGVNAKRNAVMAENGFKQLALAELGAEGSERLLDAINASGFGSNPDFVRVVARIVSETGEDKYVDGVDNHRTDEQTDDEIRTLMGSKEYMDDRLPGHQAAVDKVRRLFEEKANPLNKKAAFSVL
jgi:hypothetical protein